MRMARFKSIRTVNGADREFDSSNPEADEKMIRALRFASAIRVSWGKECAIRDPGTRGVDRHEEH
jgi:hypothetical protein